MCSFPAHSMPGSDCKNCKIQPRSPTTRSRTQRLPEAVFEMCTRCPKALEPKPQGQRSPVALGAPGWTRGWPWPSNPQPVRAGRRQGEKTLSPSLPFPSPALFSSIFFFPPYQLSPAWSCPKQPLPLQNIKFTLKSQLFRGGKKTTPS